MSRRWRNVTVHDHMLSFALRGRPEARISSDWPEDAQIVNGHWDRERALMVLTVESTLFDEVPVGNHIMEWSPTFTAHAIEPGAKAVMDLIDRMQREA